MFESNFRYTNEIVRQLTKISASREILLNSPLIPVDRRITERCKALTRKLRS
jgi:hypothetical protein